ncbi:hypothetical protein GCM10010442_19220 [Kitasatospora kifunensis]
MLAGPGFWDTEIARAGWSRVQAPELAAFPETAARGSAWGRNFYVRGRERLVLEWSDAVTLSAVLLNGEQRPVGTAEELSAVIQAGRPAGPG